MDSAQVKALLSDLRRDGLKLRNLSAKYEVTPPSIYEQKLVLLLIGRIQGRVQVLEALLTDESQRGNLRNMKAFMGTLRPIFDKFIGRESGLYL